MNDSSHSNEMNRRNFIETTGLGAVAGVVLAQWPWFGFAEDLPPDQRAKKLA